VQYARDGLDLVVVPGHAERKTWWRNLTEPSPVQVLLDGSWRAGVGRVLWADDPGYERSLLAYRRRFARARVPLDAPVVRIAPGS
jgi:hypothetical protein